MTLDEIRTILTQIAPTIDWSAIGADDSRADAGLDSLDKASVIMEIETVAGVKIDDARYEELATMADLMAAAAAA